MKRFENKIGLKFLTAILCLFLLIAGIMVFSTIRSVGFDRMAGTKLLHQIQANTQAYRLAEMEYALSLEKEAKDTYINRMESVLRQLERDQREFEPLLATGQEQAAYAAFNSDWSAYLKESKPMRAGAAKKIDQQAIAVLTQKSRELYEKSSQALDTLVEVNSKAPESWSDLINVFFKANRLGLIFFYICGVTAFLILLFNLYDRAKRRRINDKIRK